MPGRNVPAIKVNTLGYPWNWEKTAIFNVKPEKGKAVVKHEDGKTALVLGEASVFRDMGKDEASQDKVWQVSFPILTTSGKYYIESKGVKSDLFEIGGVGQGLYASVLKAALKHFYFQRCRTALTEPYAAWEGSLYTRASACHTHAGIAWDYADYPQKKKRWKPEAGWHDAGNFEMYVPSTAPTCQALLTAFERHPDLFKDGQLSIPESGNGVPDILDEAAWGLRWILSLQQEDGGVRHREAVFDWSQEGPADHETKDHWIAGVGTASTAKACAAFAQAARVYAGRDKAFADKCRKAALRSWKFLKAHPERITVDGKGSGQPLWDDGVEYPKETGSRLAASVEMWRTFQGEEALAEIRKWMKDPDSQLTESMGSWVNLSRVGLYGLAFDARTPWDLKKEAKDRILKTADLFRDRVENRDGYRCATSPKDYYWGHNSNLMEKAELLSMAAALSPAYAWAKEAARDQWHWILGRNPNGFSMVTRVGKGPTALYHMEWGSSPVPPPGYLVGGPNHHSAPFLSPAAPAKALLWDNPGPLPSGFPAHALWHWKQSDLWDGGFLGRDQWDNGWWTVTEPDIYYNANLVLVAAEMQE